MRIFGLALQGPLDAWQRLDLRPQQTNKQEFSILSDIWQSETTDRIESDQGELSEKKWLPI